MNPTHISTEAHEGLVGSAELSPWLSEIMTMTGAHQPPAACHVLASVLHALRAELPAREARSLRSELPAPIQEIYDESDAELERDAPGGDTAGNFISSVARGCPGLNEEQTERAIWAVFTLLSHHLSPEVVRSVRGRLPEEARALWNTAA